MNTQWRKIVGDFRQHRRQIGFIGFVLALGTIVVVAALNAQSILKAAIPENYARSNSPDIQLTFDQVDAKMLDFVRAQPGVFDADARRVMLLRVAGKKPGEWIQMMLFVLRDLEDQRVGVIHQHNGKFPPGDAGLLVEQSSLTMLPGDPSEKLNIRVAGGGTVPIAISGLTHDTSVAPGFMERVIYAYATPAIAAKLGQSSSLDQIIVIMEDRRTGVTQMVDSLRAALTAKGYPPIRVEGLANTHPHAGLMSALMQIFQGFAVMAFCCTAAVAAYVVSLWMKREVRQVGIMKTIGATTRQLAVQYLSLVGPFVVAATALAMPLGIWLGRWAIAYTAREQNLDIDSLQVSSQLFAGEILFTLGIPFLAMAVPIIRAARMSAREAIQDPGITAPVSSGALSTKLVRLPGDRRWTFALRNAFRRKWRLFVTVAGLSLGGAVLLSAYNIYESLMSIIDVSVKDRGQDIQFSVSKPIPVAQLEAIARGLPGVQVAEAWRRTSAEVIGVDAAQATTANVTTIGPRDAGYAKRALVSGYPVDTQLKKLTMQEGRWPAPGEMGVVVMTRPLQRGLVGVKLDSEIELKFRDRTARARVVGFVNEINAPYIYVDSANFETMTGVVGIASELRLKIDTTRTDEVLAALDQAILDAGVSAGPIATRWEFRKSMDEHFSNFVIVCTVIALGTALVGAIGLVAFTSLNILERTREIGVIRAVGATPGNVTAMFLAESGSTALLSFVLAALLSYPATYAFNQFVGNNAFMMPVPVVVSKLALGLLFSGLLVIMLAVALTISRMLRMSVRDALAYE